jgi:hypothetical protein
VLDLVWEDEVEDVLVVLVVVVVGSDENDALDLLIVVGKVDPEE